MLHHKRRLAASAIRREQPLSAHLKFAAHRHCPRPRALRYRPARSQPTPGHSRFAVSRRPAVGPVEKVDDRAADRRFPATWPAPPSAPGPSCRRETGRLRTVSYTCTRPNRPILGHTCNLGQIIRPDQPRPLGTPALGTAKSPFVHESHCKSFGIWPLSQAAKACFGTDQWPSDRAVPQVSIEFDVADAAAVDPAARDLEQAGYELLHGPREEPWGQMVARLQSPRARSSASRTRPCYTIDCGLIDRPGTSPDKRPAAGAGGRRSVAAPGWRARLWPA